MLITYKNIEIKVIRAYILFFVLMFFTQESFCQTIDSTTFNLISRLSFYSFEKTAEMLLHVPPVFSDKNMMISLKLLDRTVYEWKGKPAKRILRLPFDFDLAPSIYNVGVEITLLQENDTLKAVKYITSSNLVILSYKSNEVKTDRLTGGFIVNRRQFFPFGFYCYSPVYPTLPEEEVVKGFNMISPYQKILPKTLNERKAYMDRCARLGMKVHYNLLSVAGGGGVISDSDELTPEEKRALLINEIKIFRDHPALLAWYISDEPSGNNISPEALEEIYKVVKKTDPWHPVSIVFMAPFKQSGSYANAMDIVMADPYPVPDSPISQVGAVAQQLRNEFNGEKPVWIVPQVFGGGEWWGREPTIQEIRSMTYQAIIRGARGIQYFVRQGLNSFPKSTAAWGECGRMAVEIAELTPWLLSDEETIPVESLSNTILASTHVHDKQLLVMAVSTANEPQRTDIRIAGITNGKARVLFENRYVDIRNGVLTDWLSPFGSQVYMIDIKTREQPVKPFLKNLVKDPGFEDISSPGIPASCYARTGEDRGATFFLNSREHYEGNHSIRIITPENNKSLALRFYPFVVSAGSSYRISVWVKADPEQRLVVTRSFWDKLFGRKMPMSQYVDISMGDYGKTRFIPEREWQEFVTYVTIPVDQDTLLKTNITLRMPGAGVAWFDLLQVVEDPVISSWIDPETNRLKVEASSVGGNVDLHYTTDGTTPSLTSNALNMPVTITQTTSFKTGLFIDDTLRSVAEKQFIIHKATGKKVRYLKEYVPAYSAGGRYGLVDGVRGGPDHLDGKWQAFNGQNGEFIIDLAEKTEIHKVTVGCLQNISFWIFMPLRIEVFGSNDNKTWSQLGTGMNYVAENESGYILQDIPVEFYPVYYQYIKVVAQSMKTCPAWHRGRGKACYIYLDEIVVE